MEYTPACVSLILLDFYVRQHVRIQLSYDTVILSLLGTVLYCMNRRSENFLVRISQSKITFPLVALSLYKIVSIILLSFSSSDLILLLTTLIMTSIVVYDVMRKNMDIIRGYFVNRVYRPFFQGEDWFTSLFGVPRRQPVQKEKVEAKNLLPIFEAILKSMKDKKQENEENGDDKELISDNTKNILKGALDFYISSMGNEDPHGMVMWAKMVQSFLTKKEEKAPPVPPAPPRTWRDSTEEPIIPPWPPAEEKTKERSPAEEELKKAAEDAVRRFPINTDPRPREKPCDISMESIKELLEGANTTELIKVLEYLQAKNKKD